MFSHCVSFSSLRVNTNVSYTLLYHPHTTGKRPSFFFFRFCGDARGYYVFFYAPTTTFFRFVETPPPFETFSTIHTLFAFGRRMFGDGVFVGDEETMETLVRERERRLWAFDDDDDDDGFFVVVVVVLLLVVR